MEDGGVELGVGVRLATEEGYGGAGDDGEGDHGGGGVAGEAEEEFALGLAEDEGLAGLHFNSGEKELGAEFGEDDFDEVVLAGRDAAGEEEQVKGETFGDEAAGVFEVVLGDGEDGGEAAGLADLGGDGIRVRIADLFEGRGGVDGDDFVACGEDGDAGLAIDVDLSLANGGEYGDVVEAEAGAAGEDDAAGVGVAAGGGPVFAGAGLAGGGHLAVRKRRVFDHDYSVGAEGHGGTSHDFDALAGEDFAGEAGSGADFPDDLERAGEVGTADAVAIADAAGGGGIVAVGGDVGGEDAASGVEEGNGFGFGEGGDALGDGGQGLKISQSFHPSSLMEE